LGPVRFSGVTSRGLTQATCEKYRYGWAPYRGQLVQVAQYAAKGGPEIVAQHWRSRDKDFGWVGEHKRAETLFGKHLWSREGGKRVIVTEGEIDCLSVAQVLDLKWPVVSLANGAGGAERAVRDNLEWLETFEEVVLMFDMDEPGQAAAKQAAAILSPGKAKIAVLPLKDANEMLMAGRARELSDAQWNARPWRPDGVLMGQELWSKVQAPLDSGGVPLPWAGLQAKMHGLRRRELITVCAGTGIGKSTLARELAVHLIQQGEKVGVIALEESARETVLGMLGILSGKYLRLTEPDWSALEPLWVAGLDGKLAVYDHFATLDPDILISRLRYMAQGLGCGWLLLDHLTIAMADSAEDGERQAIDKLMQRMVKLKEELGVGLIVVSQLKRPPGQGTQFEDGRVPRQADLRGSSSIEQGSNIIIGLARNQAGGETQVNLHVLKNRFSGETGPAGALEWSLDEGRFKEVTLFEETDGAQGDV
jgi:twinkle protein